MYVGLGQSTDITALPISTTSSDAAALASTLPDVTPAPAPAPFNQQTIQPILQVLPTGWQGPLTPQEQTQYVRSVNSGVVTPQATTATASAAPSLMQQLTAWLDTGNNKLYTGMALAGVIVLGMSRRRRR